MWSLGERRGGETMKNLLIHLLFLFTLLLLGSGCAYQQPVMEQTGPLYVQYDIQYSDYTMVGIDLMVMSPDLPRAADKIEADLFEAFTSVSHAVTKEEILKDQTTFRNTLNDAFAEVSPYGDSAHIVLMSMNQGNWFAQR